MNNEIKMSGISSMSVSNIIDLLTKCYVSLIKNNGKVKDFPSVMLFGPCGVGKSQAVREIADNIASQTGKKVNFKDIRLLLLNVTDLMGLPIADDKKTKAIWLTPEMFQLDDSDNVINVLLLDEITACPPSLAAASYQLVLDRKVGEHKLPDNTIIIAAGNRVTDKSVAYKMPKALANRFLHFEVTNDFDHWKNWAMHAGIHPMVLGFLAFRPDYLNTFDPSNDNVAFATPRSWELVSNILNTVSDDMKIVYPLIIGLVGSGVAVELKSWYKIYSTLPKIETIFNGKCDIVPNDSSAIFALCCSLIQYASTSDIKIDKIINSLEYASKFPKEFFVMLAREYLLISEKLSNELKANSQFISLVGKYSTIMNGQANHGYFKRTN